MYPGSSEVRSKGGEKSGTRRSSRRTSRSLHGLHGLACPLLVGRAGDHGPGLGDGVDLAFVVLRRSERRPVVEEGALVPLPVPRLRVQRGLERRGGGPPARRTILFPAAIGDPGELPQVRDEKPAQPDALAPALVTDAVHAVVPIPGPDQRQAVAAHVEAPVQGPGAVFVQRRPVFRLGGLEVGLLLPVLQGRPVEPRNLFVENRRVLGGLEIVCHRIRQPEAIVGDPSPNSATGRRMPPVLDIALAELPGCGSQQVFAHEVRPRHHQRQHVLELIAESVGASGLVERGARPDAARERLIEKPTVRAGGSSRDRASRPGPCPAPGPSAPRPRGTAHRNPAAVALDQRSSLLGDPAPAPAATAPRVRSPGSSSTVVRRAAQGSRPAPVFPDSSRPRSSDAGWSRLAFRPRNSRRSPVQEVWRPPRSANAIRSANSPFQALRANSAPVAESISVTTCGAEALRDTPSTHSA